MARSQEIITAYLPLTGYSLAAMRHQHAYLRDAGMVPMGEKGRGERIGHYRPEHYANLILSFAASTHAGVVATTKALHQAVLLPASPHPPNMPPLPRELPTVIEMLIRGVADGIIGERDGFPAGEEVVMGALPMIRLCTNNPWAAELWWRASPGTPDVGVIYSRPVRLDDPAMPPLAGIPREAIILPDIIELAGRLWAQTPAEIRLGHPVSEGGPVGPAPENENAEILPGISAHSYYGHAKPKRDPGPINAQDNAHLSVNTQGQRVSRAATLTKGTATHEEAHA